MFARRLFFVRFPLSSGNPSSFVLFAFIDFLIFAAFHCLLSLFPLLCPSFLPGCTFLGGFIIFEHHFTLFFFFFSLSPFHSFFSLRLHLYIFIFALNLHYVSLFDPFHPIPSIELFHHVSDCLCYICGVCPHLVDSKTQVKH